MPKLQSYPSAWHQDGVVSARNGDGGPGWTPRNWTFLGSGIWLCSFPSSFCKPGHPVISSLDTVLPMIPVTSLIFDLEPSAFWGKTVALPLKAAKLSLILLVELVPRCPAALSLEACFLTFGSSSEKVFPCLHPSSHPCLANNGAQDSES